MDRNNKTCSELIEDELKRRIADFEQALKSYEEKGKVVTEDGDEYEDVIDWINNYALGYYDDERFRARRLELSYGGPQDYFLYFPSNELIEYNYITWGDSASIYLYGIQYDIMLKIFKMLEPYNDEYEYEEYQPFDEEEFEEFENYDGIEEFDEEE
jgi:hypothetical protein